MISGEEIAGLIKNPYSIEKDQLEDIDLLIEKYPYCSSLYIIQLLGLAKISSVHFEQKLKIAASNVSDREHLFFLVNPDIELQIKEEDKKTATSKSEKEKFQSSFENNQDEEAVIEKELDGTAKESEPKEKEDQEIQPESQEEIDKRPAVPDELERSIISEAVTAAYDLESTHTENEEQDSQFNKKEDLEVSSETDQGETELPEKVENEAEKSDDQINLEESVDIEFGTPISENEDEAIDVKPENMTFIQWLKYKQAYAEHSSAQSQESTKRITPKKEKSKQVSEKQGMSKKEINQLLDKFIEEEPTISRPRKEFFNPSQSAKKSLEESEAIVSETLAKIHHMQGNYSKAIAAYEQLSLLYPEKKAFFANQIKKIKSEQTQDK